MKKAHFGFVVNTKQHIENTEFTEPVILKATVGITLELSDQLDILFDYEELSSHDEMYENAIRKAFEYLIDQTYIFEPNIKITVTETYWFDLQHSPTTAVAYAAFYALYELIGNISISFKMPYFNIFTQKIELPFDL